MTYTLPLTSEFATALPELGVPWRAIEPVEPTVVALNEALAGELGLDVETLRSGDGARAMLGNELAAGAVPVAQVYAGHQFGAYSPRLGDGRALLLGELDTQSGVVDVHLKGSGPTPFSRGGDGFATLGAMLREYVVSEAMHARGVPTTRALAVIATGRRVPRDGELQQGAVLVRVASSHLRVGTFQYARSLEDRDLLARLARFALARHDPDRAEALDLAAATPSWNGKIDSEVATALLEETVRRQGRLIADWTLSGFVHGVMNTDNMTISGETIDYGPCAFLDEYDPAAVFSSIDHGGRYAFGAQLEVGLWNLTRLAEAQLPLHGDDAQAAAAALARTALAGYGPAYDARWIVGMRDRLELDGASDADVIVTATELLATFGNNRTDYTLGMRERSRRNPLFTPRNLALDAALTAAERGDLAPFGDLLRAVRAPFDEHPGLEHLAEPPGAAGRRFVSYCGT